MARFVANPAWIREFLASDRLAELVDEAGEQVIEHARELAAGHVESGDFLESLQKTSGHYRTGRPYARVYSDDPAALSIEFGTANAAAQRILGRAIRMI
jgi:hypothetical protein